MGRSTAFRAAGPRRHGDRPCPRQSRRGPVAPRTCGSKMRRMIGDRRQKPRFDIVGELSGTLDAAVLMPIRDVGRGGAQVESSVQLPPGSLHWTTFSGDGVDTAVQVRVRHVRPVVASTGEQRYLLGIEFLSPSPVLLELVERWLGADGGGAYAMEGAN